MTAKFMRVAATFQIVTKVGEEMSQQKDQADFAVIRKRVSMQMILDHYGITNLKRKGDELRGPCPIHEENKGERCFQVNVSKNIFHCFYCHAGGNVIDLVAKLEGCNIREAGLKIDAWLNLSDPTSSPPSDAHLSNPPAHQPATESPDVQQEILSTLKEILAELRLIRVGEK